MIFVDTGAWIALTDSSDQYHFNARRIYTAVKQQHATFLTTDYVIDETITRLRYDADHPTAMRCLNLLFRAEEAGVLHIENIDPALLKQALDIFRQYADVVFSVTDCASFAVCKMHHIQWAFSFGHHFTMMGLSLYSNEGVDSSFPNSRPTRCFLDSLSEKMSFARCATSTNSNWV